MSSVIPGFPESELFRLCRETLKDNKPRSLRSEYFKKVINGQTLEGYYDSTVASFGNGVVITVHNVTDSKLKELELQKAAGLIADSEEDLRLLFENSFDALLLTNPNGDIYKCNAAAKRLFGYSEEEICGIGRIGLADPSDENWEKAEGAIVEACAEKGLKTTTVLGEAAFYGPKLDFMIKDALGRSWQLGTIQVDYNLPERFKLEYTGADDKPHRPVMIHRAPFGSMERFCAVLIEHTAGKFPLWLTPEQVVVLPISEKYNDYAQKVLNELNISDIRTVIDERNEKIGRKIRDNELKRIPYLLIVGEKEAESGTVSVRRQGEGDKGSMTVEAFADFIRGEIRDQLQEAFN
jgi:PAS domain-containing protein